MEYGYAVANAKGVSADRVILTEAAMPDLAALAQANRDVGVYTSGITDHAMADQSQAIGHDPAPIAQGTAFEQANIPANLLRPNAPQDQHEFDLSQGFGL